MNSAAQPMVEIHRGPFVECLHMGHAVICNGRGEIVDAWGNPQVVVMPRSSSKMIQALPLITTGAAASFALTEAQLALACASHQGATSHVTQVDAWLSALGLSETDLRCGPQPSRDGALRRSMIREGEEASQLHNNCSGKHTGFLTLAQHLGAGPEYIEPDHPVQKACLDTFEEITGETSAGFGIDGCSAPNHAVSMVGMARAMAFFATAAGRGDLMSKAAVRLVAAMYAHPLNVAGEGRACTLLMRAALEPVALKTGAEGYFSAILPARGLGIALKIVDGATRASECAIAAILVQLGVLEAGHPDVAHFLTPEIRNRRRLVTGRIQPASGFPV